MAKNPLDELLQAAALANRTDVANIEELAKLPAHQDSAIRCWGAIGLCSLGKGAASANDELATRRCIQHGPTGRVGTWTYEVETPD